MQLSRKEILEKLQDIMISINDNDREKIEAKGVKVVSMLNYDLD